MESETRTHNTIQSKSKVVEWSRKGFACKCRFSIRKQSIGSPFNKFRLFLLRLATSEQFMACDKEWFLSANFNSHLAKRGKVNRSYNARRNININTSGIAMSTNRIKNDKPKRYAERVNWLRRQAVTRHTFHCRFLICCVSQCNTNVNTIWRSLSHDHVYVKLCGGTPPCGANRSKLLEKLLFHLMYCHCQSICGQLGTTTWDSTPLCTAEESVQLSFARTIERDTMN